MAHSSWGSGWPNCQPNKIDSNFSVSGTKFPGGVRYELCDLVKMLVQETKNRGYRFGNSSDPSYGCWGYSCRAISGSSNPSNHSWGLAVDINAPSNPYTSPLKTDMPSWMPQLWESYGFRWGGNYSGSKDAMHYEFMGSVQDAQLQTDKARKNGIGGGTPQPGPTPQPEDDDDMKYQLVKGKTGNGATFAYCPGRFFHVPGPSHLDIGHATGLWDANIIRVVDNGWLDVMRDDCVGNSHEEGPNSKGVNIVNGLPSDIAK